MLGNLYALDPVKYLAEYGGMPGLVKGATWGMGSLVFSENLKYYTRVCSSRVSGNRIKFNYGSEEIKQERAECWEFAVKRQRIEVITRFRRQDAQQFPFSLTRPDETKCPCCYDDLSGNVVCCNHQHQVCLPCFNLMPVNGGVKKCPLCNTPTYSREEYDRVDRMNGLLVKEDPYFLLTLRGGNSFKDYTYNEALFMGMLKNVSKSCLINVFDIMLISSFYNFYIDHRHAFSSYDFNILNQVNGNNRTFNPFTDGLNAVFLDYIDAIQDFKQFNKIYNDVAHTSIYLHSYEDIQFYRELEAIENNIERIKDYPNGSKEILKREILFRYKISLSTTETLKEKFIDILKLIISKSKNYRNYFETIEREVE
jgi:hypothetical protein